MSKYKKKFDDSIIILVGNGSQEGEIKALIRKLNLEDLFILTGFQENIKSFYPIIDIFFLPSLYEGLPMVLLEAMAFKKPVVSMNVGSISEVINKDTGILVNSGDYDRFINELIVIKNSNDLSIELGEKSYIFVEDKFNINSYVNKIEDLYVNKI